MKQQYHAHCKKVFERKGNCQWQNTYIGLGKRRKKAGDKRIFAFCISCPSLALELFPPPVQDSQGLNLSEGCLLWGHSRELRDVPLTQTMRRVGYWKTRGYSSQASSFAGCMLVCTWKVLEPGEGITSGVILADSLPQECREDGSWELGGWAGN